MTLNTVVTGNTILAADINQCVNLLNQIDGDTGAVSLSGSTNGTAILYEQLQATVKRVIIVCNAFRNGGAGVQTIALPTGFTVAASISNMGGPTFTLVKVGVTQNCFIITALVAGGGTGVSQANVNANSIGVIQTGFDTISFNGSAAGNATGIIILEGT